MILLRAILLIVAAVLAGAIFWAMGADDRGLGAVLAAMGGEPWTVVTLIDLYLGFFIAALAMVLFEKNRLVAFFWAVPVFFLGNVWTALWVVVRLPEIARRIRG